MSESRISEPVATLAGYTAFPRGNAEMVVRHRQRSSPSNLLGPDNAKQTNIP
jgi:hypothetical protein